LTQGNRNRPTCRERAEPEWFNRKSAFENVARIARGTGLGPNLGSWQTSSSRTTCQVKQFRGTRRSPYLVLSTLDSALSASNGHGTPFAQGAGHVVGLDLMVPSRRIKRQRPVDRLIERPFAVFAPRDLEG